MEKRQLIILSLAVGYVIIVYLFSLIGNRREIGRFRLFWISLLLTPLLGFAFFISSQHRKIMMYTEKRYKCQDCGYVFSENHENCPICEKEGRKNPLLPVNMYMS